MVEDSTTLPSVSPVGFARILDGYKPFKDPSEPNNNPTFRGQIETTDGSLPFAIIKALPEKELANEIVATIIGLTAGLKVPRAYLALAPDDRPEFSNAAAFDGGRLLFCSCDVEAPSVATRFTANESVDTAAMRRVVELLAKEDMAALYEFDEWTANVDRHHANLLLAGSGLWMIDHGSCFTGAVWQRHNLDPSIRYRNKLQTWVTPYLTSAETDDAISKVGRLQTLASSMDVRKTVIDDILYDLLEDEDVEQLTRFIDERIPRIRDFAIEAFGRLT